MFSATAFQCGDVTYLYTLGPRVDGSGFWSRCRLLYLWYVAYPWSCLLKISIFSVVLLLKADVIAHFSKKLMLRTNLIYKILDYEDAWMFHCDFGSKPEHSWTCTATTDFYAIESATAILSKKNEHGYVANRISCYF